MKSGHDHLQRADVAAWMTITVIAAVVVGSAVLGPFELNLRSFLIPATVTTLLAASGWFYRSVRNEPKLGATLSSTAHLIGFAAVAAPLSYIAATAGFPLQDAALEAWDRQMGIDWTELLNFVSSRPHLQNVLFFAYSSFALQTVTTVLVLGLAGQLIRLGAFMNAFFATTLITIAVSAIYPATGPWLFLDIHQGSANGFLPSSSTSWPVFIALRDGTLHKVDGLNSEGIITFPSLHAALGVLFPAALWRVKRVRWIALGLNGVMLVATPTYGSHYVIDVIAGIVVAATCWTVVARILDAASETRLEPFAAIHAPSIVPESSTPAATAFSREFESAGCEPLNRVNRQPEHNAGSVAVR